LINIKSKFLD